MALPFDLDLTAFVTSLGAKIATAFGEGVTLTPTGTIEKMPGYSDVSAENKVLSTEATKLVMAGLISELRDFIPTRHVVGAADEPPFENSFTARGDTLYADGQVRFWKDVTGEVVLEGLVNCPATPNNKVIFTLPVGHRPRSGKMFPTVTDNVFGTVYVYNDGRVYNISSSTGWISLDSIRFKAA